jgi:pimeloyl-ACP methyl ester carboxylesterase
MAGEAPTPAVHDTGAGPALLFLHAFPLDASQWDHQVAALSGSHRCLRPDIWGCGASPPPPSQDATLDAYARAVLGALDGLGVEHFSVIGLSMGGYIAFALWRLAAERISALALCNTRATADSQATRTDRMAVAERVIEARSVESLVEPTVERLLGLRARSEGHITDPVRARIRQCTPAGIAYAQHAMASRPDSSDELASISVSTLVIGGDEDAVIASADTRALAEGIAGAQLTMMPSGHLSNLEQPQEFNDLLAEFLAGTRL